MSLLKKNNKGFTLIELVIVLAIAALILAGILIAVSGAQVSRRDTARKHDAATIESYLEQSASNFNGNYPGSGSGDTVANFTSKYLTAANFKNPSGGNYVLPASSGSVGTKPAWSGADTVRYTVAGRQVQVCIDLESKDVSCVDNR